MQKQQVHCAGAHVVRGQLHASYLDRSSFSPPHWPLSGSGPDPSSSHSGMHAAVQEELVRRRGGAALVPLPVRVWDYDASESGVPSPRLFSCILIYPSVRLAGTGSCTFVPVHGRDARRGSSSRGGRGGGRFPRPVPWGRGGRRQVAGERASSFLLVDRCWAAIALKAGAGCVVCWADRSSACLESWKWKVHAAESWLACTHA